VKNRLASQDPILQAAELLQKGSILAIKGLGGFHLAADAANDQAVRRLRARKMREEKPFAVMAYDDAAVRRFADLDTVEGDMLTSIQRPIVLLRKKADADLIGDAVAPRNQYYGVMLPYTPLHYLLLDQGFTALVMTSGNLSEEPIAIDNEEAFRRLGQIADYFLVHNRDIYLRSDDSIVRYTAGAKRFFRRSRGFVPIPIFLRTRVPQILACGAELKNTVCLTKQNKAFLSQHIGDLENAATYDFLRLTVRHLKRILDIQPELIACDLHPDYLSTRYAEEQTDIPKIGVQHHHAHIVSCMAEHKLDGEVIGLAFDGTGLGSDHAVWGGEILVASAHRFERVGQLGYVAMPGSTAAIKEPWRMAASYLQDAFGADFIDLELPFLNSIDKDKLAVISQMINRGINAPLTSSLGRLFDGVAAICGIRNHVNFEGQAAMELEMQSADSAEAGYEFEWKQENRIVISAAPIIRGIVADIQNKVSPATIGAKFHLTLIQLFSDVCEELKRESGLNRVVLSGGCFQNATLLSGMIRTLQNRKFEVYSHEQVPTNDGGISLGQAVAAAAMYKERCA
jgi:hydrogenase maturation protein HypF